MRAPGHLPCKANWQHVAFCSWLGTHRLGGREQAVWRPRPSRLLPLPRHSAQRPPSMLSSWVVGAEEARYTAELDGALGSLVPPLSWTGGNSLGLHKVTQPGRDGAAI